MIARWSVPAFTLLFVACTSSAPQQRHATSGSKAVASAPPASAAPSTTASPAPPASAAPSTDASAVASIPAAVASSAPPSCAKQSPPTVTPCKPNTDCYCEVIELTGSPPCDLQCNTLFVNAANHAHSYRTYYDISGKTPRAIGKIETYDGSFDPPSMQSGDAHTNWVEIDESTTPPTLLVRRVRCLVANAWTTNCPVTTRLRYDGSRLVKAKP